MTRKRGAGVRPVRRSLVVSGDEIRARIKRSELKQEFASQECEPQLVDEECPGVSVHPARALPGCEELRWMPRPRGRYRVVEHTCPCLPVWFELISCGGSYMIHRVISSEQTRHDYAGGWLSAQAHVWWRRLLAGRAI